MQPTLSRPPKTMLAYGILDESEELVPFCATKKPLNQRLLFVLALKKATALYGRSPFIVSVGLP